MRQQKGQRPVLGVVAEHEEGVAPGGQVALGVQELVDRLRGVRQQRLPPRQLAQRVHRQHRVPPHKAVPVLQVGQDAGHQRLQDLGLLQAAQEAQRHRPQVLVRRLQVVAQVLADEDHLRQRLAVLPRLLYDLQVQQQQLLHSVVLRRQHVAHNGDEDGGHRLAVEQLADHVLHGCRLGHGVATLQGLLDGLH